MTLRCTNCDDSESVDPSVREHAFCGVCWENREQQIKTDAECEICSDKATRCNEHPVTDEVPECNLCGNNLECINCSHSCDSTECSHCYRTAEYCESHAKSEFGQNSCGEGNANCTESADLIYCGSCMDDRITAIVSGDNAWETKYNEIIEKRIADAVEKATGIKQGVEVNSDSGSISVDGLEFSFGD